MNIAALAAIACSAAALRAAPPRRHRRATATRAAGEAAPRDCFLLSSFSDGVLARPEVGALLRDAVQLQTGGADARTRLLYIPTAMYALRRESQRTPGVQRQRARRDGKQKRDRAVEFFGGPARCDAVTLDLGDGSVKHAVGDALPTTGEDALGSWVPHVVLVDGGNTFWLRRCMEDWLGAFAASRAVYVGVSAGAICGGRHVDTALWKGWDDPSVVEDWDDWSGVLGLDLAGGASVFPHAAAQYDGLVAEKTEARHEPLLTLDEGSAFVVGRDGGPGRFV